MSRCHTLATISLRCLSATVVPDLATLYLAWTTLVTTTKTCRFLALGKPGVIDVGDHMGDAYFWRQSGVGDCHFHSAVGYG